jgi:uncharacterized membrane protein
VTGPGPAPSEPRPWEYLLSHHFPDRYDRTLRLPIGRSGLRVCARCTAQGVGLIAFALGAALAVPAGLAFFSPGVQLAIALAPLPAAADWTTQAMRRRESTTPLRFVTGLLLGFAFGDLLTLPFVRPWWWFALGLVFVAAYMGVILATLVGTGTWKSVVEEHFPGIVAVPAPPPVAPPP